MREALSTQWANTATTTRMWELIDAGDADEIRTWLSADPSAAYVRSEDGRGPMFWAFEKKNEAIVRLLQSAGVKLTDQDGQGKTPRDM